MKGIEEFLLKDEEILWTFTEIKNIVKIPILEVLIGIILSTILSIVFNMLFYMFFQETLALIISLILFPLISFIIFAITLIIPGIKKYYEIINNLKTTLNKAIRYKEIIVITNKRIMQKSYNVFNIDYIKNPITNYNDLLINRDLVLVNLTSIHVVSTEELEESYQVAFKFTKNDKNYLPMLFEIPKDQFPEFIYILKKEIPLSKKTRIHNFLIDYYQV